MKKKHFLELVIILIAFMTDIKMVRVRFWYLGVHCVYMGGLAVSQQGSKQQPANQPLSPRRGAPVHLPVPLIY